MTREDILKLKRSNRELAQRLNLKGRFAEEVEEPKKPSTTISSTQNELTVVENSIISGKGKQFDKAWRDLIHYGDSALFDKIVHPEYYSTNHGVMIDKEQSKRLLLNRRGKAVMGPYTTIYENTDFLCIHRYSRVNKYNFFSMISGVTYKLGLVFTQQTAREQLEKDPSKQMDWDWSEYEY